MNERNLLGTLLFFILNLPTHLPAQGLDPSFGNNGIVITSIAPANDNDFCEASALQSDGKIVLAGTVFLGSNSDFAIVRYNTDGSLDNTFDNDGKVTTTINGGSPFNIANAVAIQSDGKIVAGGYTGNIGDDFALARYHTNGSLDNTFDTDGILMTDFANSNDQIEAISIQSDGKIIAAGSSSSSFDEGMLLIRYNTDGSLDNTFDTDGKVFVAATDRGIAYSIVIQNDGKIVVAGKQYIGTYDYYMTVVRFNTDGSLDNTFDGDGIAMLNSAFSSAASVTIQNDGKIVVFGEINNGNNSTNDFILLRYNTDGSLDNTFDTDGIVITDFGNSADYAAEVVLQSDGKILAGGLTTFAPDVDFAIVRYNTDGSLDSTFDAEGKMTTPILSGSNDAMESMLLQSDGKIVASGRVFGGSGGYDFAIARYDLSIVVTEVEKIGNEQGILNTYPNPAKESVTVEVDTRLLGSKYLIVNKLGQIVVAGVFNSEQNNIDVFGLPSGVYFLEILGKGQHVVKIVKE